MLPGVEESKLSEWIVRKLPGIKNAPPHKHNQVTMQDNHFPKLDLWDSTSLG